ncbi:MAG: hypothetical protein HY897_17775 [Deltaproteobacteria bacterium]|nr:hypothetical protein [Deltaproteobacteria bacterium]
MASKVCTRKEKGTKCVRCLSLADELLKVDDIEEEAREKVGAIRDKCARGAAITEAQVKYLYDLRDEYLK